MPDIKEQFIEDKKLNKDEMISPYFFSYFMNDYKGCESFFLCFERGKEVFNNLYELYEENESSETIGKNIDDKELKELLTRHIEGINNLLEIDDKTQYNIDEMEIRVLSEEEFENEFNLDDIENDDIIACCSSTMRLYVLPRSHKNPIVEFEEALYQLTLNYNIIFYVLWPLAKIYYIENPYEPYVELWKGGTTPYIINKNLLVAVR